MFLVCCIPLSYSPSPQNFFRFIGIFFIVVALPLRHIFSEGIKRVPLPIEWDKVERLAGKFRQIGPHYLKKAKANDPSLLDVSALRLFLTGCTLAFTLPRVVREAIVEISEL